MPDADIAAVAELFADDARARVLLALADGRALPASVLAAEAGVSAPAMSAHLARLREGGLVGMERSGRHRYYHLAGDQVASVLEALAGIAPARPVRSLREGTRAAELRRARTCYDHLAGRLGVAVTAALLDAGALRCRDDAAGTDRRPGDPIAASLPAHPYELGPRAAAVFAGLGVDLDPLLAAPRRSRPLLRFCVDWSEQRHHLAGRLGAALLTAMVDAGWLARLPRRRSVRLTAAGAAALAERLGLDGPLGETGPAVPR